MTDNFGKGNGDDGIDADSPRTTIARNKANINGDLGIEAVPGSHGRWRQQGERERQPRAVPERQL